MEAKCQDDKRLSYNDRSRTDADSLIYMLGFYRCCRTAVAQVAEAAAAGRKTASVTLGTLEHKWAQEECPSCESGKMV